MHPIFVLVGTVFALIIPILLGGYFVAKKLDEDVEKKAKA